MISANEHPEVVDEYLAAEIVQSRLASPFEKLATPWHTSADLGLSPRSTQKSGD